MSSLLPVDEYFLEAGVDEVGHHGGSCLSAPSRCPYSPSCRGLCARKVQPRVALLVDQQIREIHLK